MSLMSMFQYLGGIFSIRNTGSTFIIDNRAVFATNPQEMHQKLLSFLYDENIYNNALIYEDEMILLRDLGNIGDNEIKQFLGTNTTWDVLILSPYSKDGLEDVEGYTTLKKTNSNILGDGYIYIASKRFMEKNKTNNLINIETYVYTKSFIDIFRKSTYKTNKYIVSKATSLDTLFSAESKYHWQQISLKQP
jgi:hypothetical protein